MTLETPRDLSRRGARAIAFVCLAVAFYAAYHWSPFDFQVPDNEMLRRKLGWLVRVPFEGYNQNPEFTALAELFVKMGVAAPDRPHVALVGRRQHTLSPTDRGERTRFRRGIHRGG